jgi:hypothetical protein
MHVLAGALGSVDRRDHTDPLFPGFDNLGGQAQRIDTGVVFFDVGPEGPGENTGEFVERAVIQRGSPLVEVADQDVTNRCAADAIPVDQIGGRPRALA